MAKTLLTPTKLYKGSSFARFAPLSLRPLRLILSAAGASKPVTILMAILFFISFCPAFTQVQNDITLTGPATGQIKAKESITLAPDFETNNADIIIVEDLYTPPVLTPTSGGDINYIFTRSLRKEISDTSEISGLTGNDINQQVQYFDGLGRPIQTIGIGASPSKNDVVAPIKYNEFGRETEKFLPYVVAGNGQYQSNAVTDQGTWYGAPPTGVTADARPFTEITYENSPLNRVMSQLGPGDAWNKAGKSTDFAYETNSEGEVILWTVENNQCKYKDHYADGELYKTVTTDENGHAVTEYKDKQGQVVLKTAEEGTQTYYVYDDLGMLRFVIPPKAGEANGEADLKNDVLKNLCYYYEYDGRKRMTLKKLPGAGPVTMEYDIRDRLIATQDSMQRARNEKLFTTYDELNRPIRTGIQNGTGADTLVYTYYDDYSFIRAQKLNISYTDENGYTTNVTANVKGRVTGTRSKVLGTTNQYITSVNYYDKYGRAVQVQSINQFGQTDMTTNQYYFWNGVEKTMQRHRFDAGHTLSVELKYQYDQAGRLLSTAQSVNGQAPVTLSQMGYNELGQVITKNLGVSSTGALQKVDYSYNIRGWLTGINDPFAAAENDLFSLKLYYTDTLGALQSEPQYNGNISAMKWRNKADVETGYAYQAYGFTYDKLNRLTSGKYGVCNNAGVFPAEYMDRYNEGGISYDSNGNMQGLSRTGGYKDVNDLRYGLLDSLTYQYAPKSNQLMAISDKANVEGYGYNDRNADSTDFAYDGNGNLTQYKDKNIKTIEYNFLNLPEKIVFDNADSILYIYDANGSKQIKKFFENGKQKNAEYYVGSIIYETDSTEVTGDKLKYVMTSEGRMTRLKNGTFRNEYFLKDHLGNTRVVFADTLGNDTLAILQEAGYYPFGLAFTGIDLKTDKNKFLYNGKELQTDGDLGMYDYGHRFYDPQIGRYTTKDPLMEWHFNYTPYNYCFNNPISFIDPMGLDTVKASSTDPVKKDDVVDLENGSTVISRSNDATAIGHKYGWVRRQLRKIGRFFKNNTNQKGGEPVYGLGDEKTTIKAKYTGPGIDAADFLLLNKTASGFPNLHDPLFPAEQLEKLNMVVEEWNEKVDEEKETSDKDIKEKTTNDQTDADGKSLPETTDAHGNDTTIYIYDTKTENRGGCTIRHLKDTTVRPSQVDSMMKVSEKRIAH